MKRISRLFCYSILLACLCGMTRADEAPLSSVLEKRGLPVEGVTLTATLQKNAVAPGEPVLLDLMIRNEGQQPQHFLSTNPYYDFTLIVQDANGQQVPQKELPFPELQNFSRVLNAELAPGNAISTNYLVSYRYDLTKAGTYRITAMHKIFTPDATHTSDVVSNTVILTVSDHLSKDFALTSSLPESTVAAGQPIVLVLALQNTSATAKTLTLTGETAGYSFTVQDFRGDPVPPIKRDYTIGDMLSFEYTLQPGEHTDYTIDIAPFFDLSKPGRYFITATRNVLDGNGQQEAPVYANTVILTVSTPLAPVEP